MLENNLDQPNPNPGANDALLQALLRPIQHNLAKQGITVSLEEAHKLFELQIVHDAKRYLQQDLAERGIDVSPDEAFAIQKLRIIHFMMEHTGIDNPHEAI